MSIAEKLVTIAENQQKVFEAGKESEYDKFWDVFQINGTRTAYAYAFYYKQWKDDIFNPKYPFTVSNGERMFSESSITDIKQPITILNNTQPRTNMFRNCYNLVTIPSITVNETTTYGWFGNCTSLKNITFKGTIGQSIDFQYSTLLSRASIENIVGCLSKDVTGQTLTLSQTAVDNAFTTDEWNALIADKTNWTISLV